MSQMSCCSSRALPSSPPPPFPPNLGYAAHPPRGSPSEPSESSSGGSRRFPRSFPLPGPPSPPSPSTAPSLVNAGVPPLAALSARPARSHAAAASGDHRRGLQGLIVRVLPRGAPGTAAVAPRGVAPSGALLLPPSPPGCPPLPDSTPAPTPCSPPSRHRPGGALSLSHPSSLSSLEAGSPREGVPRGAHFGEG